MKRVARVVQLQEVLSTQDEARSRMATLAPNESLWIRALRQAAGRGRQGRNWLDGPGSLLVSCGFRLSLANAPRRGLLPLLAGDALFSAVGPIPQLALKWPNDLVLRDGRCFSKAAGILVESFGREGADFVVGWGVNLSGTPHIEGIPVTSLREAGSASTLTPESLLESLQGAFLEHIDAWEIRGRSFEDELLERLQTRMASFWGHAGLTPDGRQGLAKGLGPDGELRVQMADGTEELLRSGEFRFSKT